MKRFKTTLLLATVASSAMLPTAVQAQTTASNDGERQIHGTGATSIQTVLVQELNCIGGSGGAAGTQSLGLIGTSVVAGTFSTIAEPTNLPTPSGTFNCAATELHPGFLARYVGSGSGAGRAAWANAGSVSSTTAFQGVANPFANLVGTPWSKVQYAFADSSATNGDLTTYTGGTGLTGASFVAGGAPIMFPKFVLPVAIAYAQAYGRNTATSTDYRFNINATSGGGAPRTIRGNAVGGLRLSRTTLCGIFNGTILNFNNASFTADNGAVTLKDAGDTAARWSSDGVPVRLVGRVDKSGTTDIFTRAATAQCGGGYVQHAETLPYNRTLAVTSLPDFSSVRPDSGLRPAATDLEAGGSTSLRVGNTYYNRNTNAYVTVTGGSSSNPAAGAINGTGLFLVADGSSGVAAAINKAPDFASASAATVLLNGKIGYIGADYLAGSPTGAGLFAAAVQNSSGNYILPSAARATAAFGTVVTAPQTTSTGVFQPVDARTSARPTYQGGGTAVVTRANPLAWYDVLYIGAGLQNPSAGQGYPITGTTQFLGYTCYAADAGGDNAAAVKNVLKYNVDYLPTDSTGANRSGIFTQETGTTVPTSGLLARANIGALPSSWALAIGETFLNSADPKSLNLYIRNNATTTTCNTRPGV